MLVYHGTIADNLASILENGLIAESPKIWSVSHDAIYVWGNRHMESEYGEDWENEYGDPRDTLIRLASESAQCAIAKAKDCRMVIVICEVPDDELEIDDSCPNMENASCIRRSILPSEIREVLISNDLSLLKGMFIGQMMRMNLYAGYFSAIESQIGEIFQNSELYVELEDILEWETVNQ